MRRLNLIVGVYTFLTPTALTLKGGMSTSELLEILADIWS